MWLHRNRAATRMAYCGLLLASINVACQAQMAPAPGSGWLALTQQTAVIGDPLDGDPPYAPYLDVVGDKAAPSAFVSSDADYLYFRLRVAASPYHTAVHHLYGNLWACLLDIDHDPQTYELLTGLNGIVVPNTVDLDQNTSTATPDDVGDSAETSLATYDAAVNASYTTAGSTLGGAADYFVDWFVSWTDLVPAGLAKTLPFRAVCGTSTSATSLSGGDVVDGGTGSKNFSADASDSMLCDDNGCRYYDPIFKDDFEGP
jgi:hypothetical protein